MQSMQAQLTIRGQSKISVTDVKSIFLFGSSVQFSSVQDGIYALGKAHVRSTPSQQLPQCCL